MVDINEQIIREKEKLHNMLLENDYELQNSEILEQSSKVDRLITMYLNSSIDYVAATKTEDQKTCKGG